MYLSNKRYLFVPTIMQSVPINVAVFWRAGISEYALFKLTCNDTWYRDTPVPVFIPISGKHEYHKGTHQSTS